MKDIKMKRRNFLGYAIGAPLALSGLANTAFATETETIHDVTIESFKFSPNVLEVRVGDKIRWTNEDLSPHTATAKDRSWDTKKIKKGEAVTVEVTADMRTAYFCAYHPNMKAEIVILQ
jgi:plastocyanin